MADKRERSDLDVGILGNNLATILISLLILLAVVLIIRRLCGTEKRAAHLAVRL